MNKKNIKERLVSWEVKRCAADRKYFDEFMEEFETFVQGLDEGLLLTDG